MALAGELIGFDKITGEPVYAAAGLGSYLDLKRDFYETFQHESWQHPGSEGWSAAPVPGWGNNPNLQMASRRALGAFSMGRSYGPVYLSTMGLGCPECHISHPSGGCVPCPEGADLPECQNCEVVEESFFERNRDQILLSAVTAIVSGLALYYAGKIGVKTA